MFSEHVSFKLFFLFNMYFDNICLRNMYLIFVLVTLRILRLVYLSEWEILIALQNYYSSRQTFPTPDQAQILFVQLLHQNLSKILQTKYITIAFKSRIDLVD